MANYTQYENNGQKLWKVRGYLGTDELTGKQKQIQRQGFKTKKEARQAYEEAKRDFENGLEVAKPENLTYRQVYHEWLENVYTDSVKESTLHKTMVDFRIRILPVFGDIRISKITSAMLQDALNTWHKEYNNFKYYYNQTVRILDYALIQGYIHENPKHRVSTKKRKISYDSEHSGTLFYTKDQLLSLIHISEPTRRPG